MALVKVKPTSAGRRAVVKVVNAHLHKGAPLAALVEKKTSTAGRNNHGHITTRHKGGGHKQHYRVVDFRRDKDGVPAKAPQPFHHVLRIGDAAAQQEQLRLRRGESQSQLVVEAAIRVAHHLVFVHDQERGTVTLNEAALLGFKSSDQDGSSQVV